MGERLGELARKVGGMILKAVLISVGSIVLLVALMWGMYAAGAMDHPVEMVDEAMSALGGDFDWRHALGTLALAAIGFPILMDIMDEMAGMGPYERYRDWRDDRRDDRRDGGRYDRRY